jgi:hypothetical protein
MTPSRWLNAWRNFESATFSSCRILSRETPNSLPICSSVFLFPPLKPKTLGNNSLLSVVELLEQTIDLAAQIFVAQ